MNKIEEMIEAIEEYIENCKPVPLSSNKIIVEKDAIEELIRELRLKTPDEIKNTRRLSAIRMPFSRMPRIRQIPCLMRLRCTLRNSSMSMR